MSTTRIGSLVIDMIANSAAFGTDVKDMTKHLKSGTSRMNKALLSLERGFGKVGARVGKNIKGMINLRTAMASAAGTAGLGLVIRQSLNAAVALRDNAAMAGTTAEKFQELEFASRRFSVTTEALADGLKEVSLRADEFVTTGKGSAAEAFERLGLDARTVNERLNDSADLFDLIADRMRNVGSEAARIRIADELFGGQGGEQFVQMLKAGADEIGRLRDEARRLGLVMSNETVAGADAARDKLDVLGQVISTKVTVAVANNADVIDRLVDSLNAAIPRIGAFLERLGVIDQLPTDRLVDINKEITATTSQLANWGRESTSMKRAHSVTIERLKQDLKDLLRERREVEAEIAAAPSAPAAAARSPRSAAPAFKPITPEAGKTPSRHTFGNYLKVLEKNRRRHAEAIRAEGAAMTQSLLNPMEIYNQQVQRANVLLERGAISQGTYQRAINQAGVELDEAARAADTFAGVWDSVGNSAQTALERIIFQGGKASDVLRSLAADLAKTLFRSATSGLFGGGGAGGGFGGIISNLFSGGGGAAASGGNMLALAGGAFAGGFKTGGSFTVPGSGGPDSKLVGFMATPGENVNVTRPGQSLGGNFTANVSVNVAGGQGGDQVQNEAQARAIANAVRSELEAIADGRIQKANRPGGANRRMRSS